MTESALPARFRLIAQQAKRTWGVSQGGEERTPGMTESALPARVRSLAMSKRSENGGGQEGGRSARPGIPHASSPKNRSNTFGFQWFLKVFAFLGALVAFGVCVLRGVVDFS